MTLRVSVAARNAGLDARYNLVDAGSGPGVIEVRSGSQPATPETTATGTLLATFTLADPGFEVAAAGVKDLDANPDLSATAAATGTAGWARAKDSNGVAVFDGAVGTSGTEFIISSTSITSGQTVTLTLGSITAPA